jgi:hypothetical protein
MNGLTDGTAVYALRVTAEDPSYTLVYAIQVHRRSAVNTLASLSPSVGSFTPLFAPGTTAYSMTVSSSMTTFTVQLTLTYSLASATVAFNAGPAAALPQSTPSAAFTPATGMNQLVVLVTAEDGQVKSYTLSVYK